MRTHSFFHALTTFSISALLACSNGTSQPKPDDQTPDTYTVSYRSLVRVPESGVAMKHAAFAEQVGRLDPIAAKR
ncbi:MAG TPA: hypothetical protein VF518_11630, partial [Polyangia bacterium]